MAYRVLNTGTDGQLATGNQNTEETTTPDSVQAQQQETTPETQEVKVNPEPVQYAAEIKGNEPELKGVEIKGNEPELKGVNENLYVNPWAAGFEATLRQHPEYTITDAIRDYNGWAQKEGKEPLDILDMWPLMQNYDITKSLAENEQLEKKRANKERWERTANVLSHLGNFIGALAGSPSQDIESSLELTKRQQVLRDKTLEQRRQANSDYLKVYQAQQAARIAADKEKREAAYQNETLKLKQAAEERQRDAQQIQLMKLQWQMKYQQGLLDRKKAQQEIDQAYKMGQLSLKGRDLAIKELNANYTNVKIKPDGTVETVEHRAGTGGGTPAPSNTGGTPTGGQTGGTLSGGTPAPSNTGGTPSGGGQTGGTGHKANPFG